MVKGKVVGLIVERSRGFSSWIRFSERDLAWLLEGVELCCANYDNMLASLDCEEGGRVFKLKLKSNNMGRFLQCSI